MFNNKTNITSGLPVIVDADRGGFFKKKHGFFSKGKNDAKNLLDAGRNNHVKTTFEKSEKAQATSYMTGARAFNAKKGKPLSVNQRTEGHLTHVYICFTADLERICEGS